MTPRGLGGGGRIVDFSVKSPRICGDKYLCDLELIFNGANEWPHAYVLLVTDVPISKERYEQIVGQNA